MPITTYLTHFWGRCSIAIFAGAIGVLAYSPYDYAICAPISLILLQFALLGCSAKHAARIAFLWAMSLFAFGISWIYISLQQFGGLPILASIAMVLLLVCYLSIYPALYAWLLNKYWPQATLVRLVIVSPALWQVTEFLRGWVMTGFPWLQFGYTQIDTPLGGLAPIAGVEGVTYLLMLCSGLLVCILYNHRYRDIALATFIAILVWPFQSYEWYKTDITRKAVITLVQGNIPQSIKWDPEQLTPTLNAYIDVTLPKMKESDIIIWPEVAIPSLEEFRQDFLQKMNELALEDHTAIITGIIDREINDEGTNDFYNSLIVLGRSPYPYVLHGENRYRKHHLVILGEYVPLRQWLKPIGAFFNLPMSMLVPGEYKQSAVIANGYKLTPAICYEIILSQQLRDNIQADTDFILTISNDAWFGSSIGPWQHFQMARMRALELGRPLLRATNNGITAVIDANGQILQQLPQFERSSLRVTVSPTIGKTPYMILGSWPLWCITILCLLIGSLCRLFKLKK